MIVSIQKKGYSTDDWRKGMIVSIQKKGYSTDDWRRSMIVSIEKKGYSTAFDDQRGIAKTCSSAKLLNKILINRLKPIIDQLLIQCHCGFRAAMSTTEQLMTLR